MIISPKDVAPIQELLLPLVCQLRWKHALDACVRDGRDYTEIHFWRNPATDEFV